MTFESADERRARMERGLDDPGDPYGLANKPTWMLLALTALEDYRYELVRRRRLGMEEAPNA